MGSRQTTNQSQMRPTFSSLLSFGCPRDFELPQVIQVSRLSWTFRQERPSCRSKLIKLLSSQLQVISKVAQGSLGTKYLRWARLRCQQVKVPPVRCLQRQNLHMSALIPITNDDDPRNLTTTITWSSSCGSRGEPLQLCTPKSPCLDFAMSYIAPVHKPTSIRHALRIRFLSPDVEDLVVA